MLVVCAIKLKGNIMSKISVVIPVYNVEKYLANCLDSVLNQTLEDIEVICVNDGSKDNSAAILEEYARKDKRIQIVNKPNGGLSSARNKGLEFVQGDFVAFLDSDDWVAPDFYEKLYNQAVLNYADVAIGKTRYYFSEDDIRENEWVNQYVFASGSEIVTEIEDRQHIIYSCACWNKIYKTSLIKDNNLKFEEKLYIEDVPFTFAVSMLANKFVLVKDASMYYRQQQDSIMSKARTSRIPFDIFKIYEACEKILNEVEISDFERLSYKQILENFEIFNIYAWSQSVCEQYRKEFNKVMKNKFKSINIKNNPYISENSLNIYNKLFKNGKKLGEFLFSIKNSDDKKHKVVKFMGAKLKLKREEQVLDGGIPFSLKRKINKAQVVSFDIFDTLLLRPYVAPVDLFYHIEQNFNCEGFAKNRIEAEQLARKLKTSKEKEDITYDEIYDCIDEKFKYLKNTELEYEEKLLFKNPKMYAAYLYAQNKGKKIIITSDMYLPFDFIEKVLHKNGYDKYEKLYLSSKEGCTKWTGNLYKRLLKDCSVKAGDVLHIGDNMQSDIQQSGFYGIKTYYFEKIIDKYLKQNKRARIFVDMNSHNVGASVMLMQLAIRDFRYNNYWEKLGYEYGGCISYGYMKWLEKEVKSQNIKNILFVARDGYSLEKVFNLFGNDEIKTHYVYAPRFMNLICNLNYKEDDFERMSSLLNYYKNNFSKSKRKEISKIKTASDANQFIRNNFHELHVFAADETLQYKKYLMQYLNSSDEKTATIDTLTFRLSSQKLIANTLNSNNIYGYYYAIQRVTGEIVDGEYYFKPYYPEPYHGEENIKCWDFMELLMAAPEYPVKTVRNCKPVYNNNIKKVEKLRKKVIAIMSDYIVEFAKNLLDTFGDIPVYMTHKEMCDWVNVLADNPEIEDIKYMSKLRHAVDAAHTKYQPVFLHWPIYGKNKLKLPKLNLQKIFSIRNVDTRKVITILGVKFKIKSKKLIERRRWETLNNQLCECKNMIACQGEKIKQQQDFILTENQKQIQNIEYLLHNIFNSKMNTIENSLQNIERDVNFNRDEIQNNFDVTCELLVSRMAGEYNEQ